MFGVMDYLCRLGGPCVRMHNGQLFHASVTGASTPPVHDELAEIPSEATEEAPF